MKITIDDGTFETEEGRTILDAAAANGIDIPTLCDDPRLEPFASCWLCVVEVDGAPRPLPACSTRVTDGLVVRTRTGDIAATRRMALELLLSAHDGDCLAPCNMACPAGTNVQGYMALVAEGKYKEALRVIREANPFPSICGRVCPRFCQEKCRRNIVDEAVFTNAAERFVADYEAGGGEFDLPEKAPPSGHSISIIGGGPAGLSAAYFLALKGYSITVYEAKPELGGMLRYGIPAYRLPREVLKREIDFMKALGIEIKTGVAVGGDISLEELREKGPVFVAVGAQDDASLGIPGEDLDGILPAVSFLRRTAMGETVSVGKRVAVIGGGNTAMDGARTALRLGAKDVKVVYRRSRKEMPARISEIEEAEEEGVEFIFLTSPVKANGEGGKVTSLTCQRMELGEPDSSGRRRPIPIPDSEFEIEADTVIPAIGQKLEDSFGRIELTRRGLVAGDAETGLTSAEGIFAAGDCVSGPATVVEAVAGGRRAAESIDAYLRTGKSESPKEEFYINMGEPDEIDPAKYSHVEKIERAEMPARHGDLSFEELELGMPEDILKREVSRCLSCGCQELEDCKLREYAAEYGVDSKRFGGIKNHYPIEDDDEDIVFDLNKCINCGRCVRICAEVQDADALGFVGRGFETCIRPALDMSLADSPCERCGQCISTCPTGAVTAKTDLPQPGPWYPVKVPTVCPYCGVGCGIFVKTAAGRAVGITADTNCEVNRGNLCREGAFGYKRLRGEERITAASIRNNGSAREATIEEATEAAAAGLKDAITKHGEDCCAVLVSPTLTNEEGYLAGLLAEEIGIRNVAVLARSSSISPPEGVTPADFSRIASGDAVVLLDADPTNCAPVVALEVIRASRKGISIYATGNLEPKLAHHAKSIDKKGLKKLIKNKDAAVIVDLETAGKKTLDLLRDLASACPGTAFILLHRFANAAGLRDVGSPRRPAGDVLRNISEGKIKATLLIGDDTAKMLSEDLLSKIRCCAALSVFRSHATEHADVVLPKAGFPETEGSIVNSEGRERSLLRALTTDTPETWRTILMLYQALGGKLRVTCLEDVRKAMEDNS